MTDKEIIKALDCCIWGRSLSDCIKSGCPARKREGCSYYLRTDDDFEGVIFVELIKDALDLINRQKAEIERLQDVNIRLTKAEAIKEFAERLKKHTTTLFDWSEVVEISVDDLDDIVKEMVEGVMYNEN